MVRGHWGTLYSSPERAHEEWVPCLFRSDPFARLWCSFSVQTAGQARPALLVRKNVDRPVRPCKEGLVVSKYL